MIKLRHLAAAAMAAGALLLTATPIAAASTTGTPSTYESPAVDVSASASVEVSASASAPASASSSSSAPASSAPTTTAPPSTSTSTTTPAQTTPPASVTSTPTMSASGAFEYEDCDAVEEALGRAILEGEPGFGAHLDEDGDGIGCDVLGVVPSDASGGLALTGVAMPVLAGSGIGLVLVGAGLLLWLRSRNRIEFVAE